MSLFVREIHSYSKSLQDLTQSVQIQSVSDKGDWEFNSVYEMIRSLLQA